MCSAKFCLSLCGLLLALNENKTGFNYAVANGVARGTRSFTYNGRLQLGEMKDQGSSLLDLKYYYGGAATTGAAGSSTALNNGNPTGVLETAQAGTGTQYSFAQTYGYDAVNRLGAAVDAAASVTITNCTAPAGVNWTQNFSYDRYCNPWTTTNTGLPTDRLPSSNVYTAATNQSTYMGTGTTYDSGVTIANGGVGNQTVMGSSQLTYDAENRIVQDYNTLSQNSTCYLYGGLGERVYKETYGGSTCTGTATVTIASVYDAFGNLAVEAQTGSLPATPCLTCYLTWDHLGSVRMVSDTLAGGFTGFHDYAPFGEEALSGYAGRTGNWGTLTNGADYLNQRYTGAERDTETTLDFLQARYLANQQARFVSVDPVGNFVANPANPQSWNMYSYAGNNPLAYLDPSGLCTVESGQYVEDGGQPCPAPPSFSITVSGDPFATPGIYQPGTCYGIIVDGDYLGSSCSSSPGSGNFNPPQQGSGYPGPPATLVPARIRQTFTCASKLANSLSIAGVINVDESKHPVLASLTNAFAGNVFSGITDAVSHVATFAGSGVAQDLVYGGYSQGLPVGSGVAAKGLAGVATEAAVNAATRSAPLIDLSGAAVQIGAEGLAGPIGLGKLATDALTFVGSFAYCAVSN